jgi:transcriptional repressor NF-X1
MAAKLVATKLWEAQSIDVAVLSKELGSSKRMKKLQCNTECAQFERNQRLALALEIKNPDLSGKLGNPAYSQFLKDYAKQNAPFVAKIEETLAQLVTATLQPKTHRKSHAFKSMPSVQRRVIHELAEFYGCTTESFDEEPNKNVVATAVKNKCWHPNVTLTAMTQRELFPKAPVPIPINCKEEDLRTAAQAAKQSTQVFTGYVPKSVASKTGSSAQAVSKNKHREPEIDYFDVTD